MTGTFRSRPDLAKTAWESNRVGVWYGGWNAQEFEEALKRPTWQEQKDSLSQSACQRQLWGEVSWEHFNTCFRFRNISPTDWVYLYFDEALHFGRVKGALRTAQDQVFNLKNPSYPDGPPELFKYREVTEKKAFRVGQLPPSFLILRSAGRGNVYQHRNSYWHLVNMLADCQNESEVWDRFGKLSVDQWLDWADDKTWEAVARLTSSSNATSFRLACELVARWLIWILSAAPVLAQEFWLNARNILPP
jgi:hypothetical protein